MWIRCVMLAMAIWAAPLAEAMCFFNQCTDVLVKNRHYQLGHYYYVQEPAHASLLSDTQHYALYRSGQYAGKDEPVLRFSLTNTHEVCCVKDALLMTLLQVGVKVTLAAGSESVSVCAHKPNYYTSPYEVDVALERLGQQLHFSLSLPKSSPTCSEAQGEFVSGLGVQDRREAHAFIDHVF